MAILSVLQAVLSIALLTEIVWYWRLIDKKAKEFDALLEMHEEFVKYLKENRKNEND